LEEKPDGPVKVPPVPRPAVPESRVIEPAAEPGKQEVTVPGKGRGCRIAALIVGAFFVLVVMGIGALVWFSLSLTKPLAETTDYYFDAIRRGDIVTALDLTSEVFRENTSERELVSFLNKNPVLKTVVGSSFSESRIDGDRGWAVGELTTEQGEKLPVEMMFSKEPNGLGWQIDAIKFGGDE
jgi:hypothetical protein